MSADDASRLGDLLLESGDIETARYWFEQAVALEPRNGSFYWNLVFSRSGQVEDATIEAMQRLAVESSDLPTRQQIELHFALATAYESAGRYDDAFRRLQSGNALKRSTLHYDEVGTMRLFHTLEITFTHLLASRALQHCGNPSTRPVFIFGMPRSGTTLVEQLLSAHPSVAAAGELVLFENSVDECWMQPLLAAPKLTVERSCAAVRAIGDRYVAFTQAYAGGAVRVTDKQPHNFSYAPMIHLALPNARMIHVRRDPLDTCLSCYSTLFAGDSIRYSYNLGELARYYRAYRSMMSSWVRQLPSNRILEIDYESLVSDFEAEARRVVAFCDLPWDARVLDFHTKKRTVRTASRVQVRKPLYKSSVGRSRHFTLHLGGFLDALTS